MVIVGRLDFERIQVPCIGERETARMLIVRFDFDRSSTVPRYDTEMPCNIQLCGKHES